MGVEVVEKGEKGAIRPPSTQPVQEGVVDPGASRDCSSIHFLVVEVAATEDALEDPVSSNGAAKQGSRRQRVVLVMGEAAIQPSLVTAAIGVCRKPDGLIAPRGEVFSEGGIENFKCVVPLGIQLVRPLAGEETAS